MRFSLTIDCDNAAFAPVHDDASELERAVAACEEVSSLLNRLATNLRANHFIQMQRSGVMFDANGNRCGSWSLREEEASEDVAPAEEPKPENMDASQARRVLGTPLCRVWDALNEANANLGLRALRYGEARDVWASVLCDANRIGGKPFTD